MKKILMLGDSIRKKYQPFVREKLLETAEVVGPDDNCRFSKYTLWNAETWIKQWGQPDIIHWNNGTWDVCIMPRDNSLFATLDEYMETLRRIAYILKSTGAQIIWATTTPVHPDNQLRRNSDINLYNAEAVKWMISEKIAVNDLNKVILRDMPAYVSEDHLHLTDAGSEACADAVVEIVKPLL